VASFRGTKTRVFLQLLRQSQCFEVFLNERLLLASKGDFITDAFETKACTCLPFLAVLPAHNHASSSGSPCTIHRMCRSVVNTVQNLV